MCLQLGRSRPAENAATVASQGRLLPLLPHYYGTGDTYRETPSSVPEFDKREISSLTTFAVQDPTALNRSLHQVDSKVVAQVTVIGDVQDKDIGLLASF
jgi:hypothetical protein